MSLVPLVEFIDGQRSLIIHKNVNSCKNGFNPILKFREDLCLFLWESVGTFKKKIGNQLFGILNFRP
ncbi:MAG: hypothetical protein C0433_10555 [Cyclobacterium sp.]|nr:hypothetical protein [Cyclobacterium sp.]